MSLSVNANVTSCVNYAATHSIVPLVNKVEITSDRELQAVLRVYSVPEFIFEYKEKITLQTGTTLFKNVKTIFNDTFYQTNLQEAKEGEIKVEILDLEEQDKVLAFYNVPVHIQPYDHWDARNYAYTLPVYMQPNDPLVAEVLKVAGKYANEKGCSMYGYQGRSRESVKIQAEAIYKALQEMGLHYISCPASFETSGQKIRIPRRVLHEKSKQGTCLDLAILYATCLEAASLNSVIIVISGHAFAAVWLEDYKYLSSNMVTDSQEVISHKDTNGGALMPVECTAFTDGKAFGFDSAVSSARNSMDHTYYAIDTAKSRAAGLNPVYSYTDEPICVPENSDPAADEPEEVSVPAANEPEEVSVPTADESEEVPEKSSIRPNPDSDKRRMEKSDKQLSKLDKLKKQAMDFTLRNHLLSCKKDSLRLFLEEFPVSEFLMNQYDELAMDQLFHQILIDQGMKEEELESVLGRMKINDRDEKRETGHGSLFLTLGSLQWKREGEEKVYHAPLYLCPFEIEKNKRGEHICKVDRSKIRFNLVLKEFLMQEYDIDIQELKDDPEDNLEQEMAGLRYFIGKQKTWKVVENTATIGFYAIPNEAIYNGLSDEKLEKHDIVKGLLNSKMTWNKEVEDRVVPVNETGVYIFQSDSSQAAVVESACTTKAQVVIGGAGNGKSQTIGNTVAEYMKAGRNVLVLTEKISAAQVLKDLLDSVGFGPFCLEVISGKDDAKSIIRQIENSIHFMEEYEESYEANSYYLDRYQDCKDKIEAFNRGMKEKGICGHSMDELIRMHEKYKHISCDIKWDKAKTAMNHQEAEYLVEGLAETVKYSGKKNTKYTEFMNCHMTSDSEKKEALKAVDTALDSLALLKDAMTELERHLPADISYKNEKERLKKIVSFASVMTSCPVVGEALDSLLDESRGEEEETRNNILTYLDEMKEANPKSSRYKEAKKRLDGELKDLLRMGERMKLLNKDVNEIYEYVLNNKLYLLDKDGRYDRAKEEALQRDVRDYKRCLSKVGGNGNDSKVMEDTLYLICSGKEKELKKLAFLVGEKYKAYSAAQKRAETYVISDKEGFQLKYPDEMMAVLFQQWKQSVNSEKRRKGYEAIYKMAAEIGLTSILEQLEEQVEAEDMLNAFRKTWCEYNICQIASQIPEINQFDPSLYKIDIARFKDYEKKLREEFRRLTIYNQMKRLPRVQDGAPDMPELGVLNKLIRMNKKAVSIRAVFEQAPNLLFSMYPCMIMDPSAVAEYLPKDFPMFDMVIIDEGSQMPAYKALIPISKGNQCMIFGDEHQMTPTSFFKRQLEDEDGYMTAMESVLEDAIGCSMPKKMLKYHYRSEHESLIAFSNDRYYRNEIVTFPACDTKIKGVKYIFVEDGCYERGGKKINQPEAAKVIEEVRNIFDELPEDTEETVGIVTLNLAQKNLIENLLMNSCVGDEVFANYVDKLVSVVNLEACQGKEWSHVIISPAYGPDEKGSFTVNFGPIGKEDGGNRLNVLITRAKKSMHVVTSLLPEMIGKTDVAGTKDFRDFLSYARGSLQYDTRQKDISREEDSLVHSIASSIRELGYEVHTNIGASKCKVDIGVVSKQDPDTYMMGILLDQFTASGFSVKDTEVIRSEVLKKKGWNVYRIHTLNWYEDAEYEADLLRRELEKIEENFNEK